MRKKLTEFQSEQASLLTEFYQEKRSCGYKYQSGFILLHQLDRLWLDSEDEKQDLSRIWLERFIQKRSDESPHGPIRRTSIWRELARYARRKGLPAFLPGRDIAPIFRRPYIPFIYTRSQLNDLFRTADEAAANYHCPRRPYMMGLILRLLYGAGLRLGEALALRIGDYDPNQNMLTIRQGKNQKDRLIPLSSALGGRAQEYFRRFPGMPTTPIFLSPCQDAPIQHACIEKTFRNLLPKAGLPPRVHRVGPRIHDLRHTFAVHRLENWYLAGEDLTAKLPILSVYMGHKNMRDTYYYLRTTASFYPEIARRLEVYVGDVIPREASNETY